MNTITVRLDPQVRDAARAIATKLLRREPRTDGEAFGVLAACASDEAQQRLADTISDHQRAAAAAGAIAATTWATELLGYETTASHDPATGGWWLRVADETKFLGTADSGLVGTMLARWGVRADATAGPMFN